MTQLLQLAGKNATFCSRTYRKSLESSLEKQTFGAKNQTDILEFKNIKKKNILGKHSRRWEVPTRSVNVNIDLQKSTNTKSRDQKDEEKRARPQGIEILAVSVIRGLPGSSDGKGSACKVGDLPNLSVGRVPEKGMGNPPSNLA